MLKLKLITVLMMAFGLTSASHKFGLRLGGKACQAQPNYCQNGGTCYTQVAFQTVAPFTTSTPTEVPVCGCQPEYAGPQCQVPVTTLQPLTPAPTQATTQAPVVCTPPPTPAPTEPPRTLPPLICNPPTTPAPTPACTAPQTTPAPTPACTAPPTTPAPTPACTAPPTTPAPTPACTAPPTTVPQCSSAPVYGVGRASEPRNLCNLFNDKGMSICQNGGKCVFVADLKINCICAEGFYGQFCERKGITVAADVPVTQPSCSTE